MDKKEQSRQNELSGKIERMKRITKEFNKVMFECKDEDIGTQFRPGTVQSGNIQYYQLEAGFYIKKGQVEQYFAEPPKSDNPPTIEIVK